MLAKAFNSALLHWEKVKESILHLCTLQKCHQVIYAVLHQILLEGICNKTQHKAFCNQAVTQQC